ncbi:MAG: hypothetical protein KAT71_08150 [Gammaproteobacteria bacterium]|nr:hypothetical protein [Gammaproteobacteria bacterium]
MSLDIKQVKEFADRHDWELRAEDDEQHLMTFRTKKVVAVLDIWDGKRGITMGLLLRGQVRVREKMYFRRCKVKDVMGILADVDYWQKLIKEL